MPRYTLGVEYRNWPHWQAKVLGKYSPSKRARVVSHALWAVHHSSLWPYSENTTVRSRFLRKPRGVTPVKTDCSGFVTWCYWMSRLPDPNKLGYARLGFTGTLLSGAHTIHTDPAYAKPGDPIVVGPGEGDHVYVCVKAGANPLCASHGSPGVEPVRLLNDGRLPYRVCVSL